MAFLRFKIVDTDGTIKYIPNESGWEVTAKVVKESSTIDISALKVGLATVTLQGSGSGFVRGILVTCKSKIDTIWTTTMIGSIQFSSVSWADIDNRKMYIYVDILNCNISVEYDVVHI